MIYVGINVAKLNYFASAISSDGEVLIELFQFTNDADVFYLLSSSLDSFPDDSIIIGLEYTAHYDDNLVHCLENEGYQVCVINPSQTSAMRKNDILKIKSDKVDTFIIARTLMMTPCKYFVPLHFIYNSTTITLSLPSLHTIYSSSIYGAVFTGYNK